jgi:hypothetical protein
MVMSIVKYGRYWKVIDTEGALICLTVYKKGAAEAVRRLEQAVDDAQQWQEKNGPTEDAAGGTVSCGLF